MAGESRRGLIDTSVVIDLAEADRDQLPDQMALSTVSLAELSAGPHHTDDMLERARRVRGLQRAEAAFEPLPFDARAARAFGLVSAAVLATGRQPRRRFADLMIASVAVASRLPLYTANPEDFRGLEHLLTVRPVRLLPEL